MKIGNKKILDCISYDGNFFSMSEEVFMCHLCYRTIRVPKLRTYQPNLICKCQYPNFVTMMGFHAIVPPHGYRIVDDSDYTQEEIPVFYPSISHRQRELVVDDLGRTSEGLYYERIY